jgi:hypothetical protein
MLNTFDQHGEFRPLDEIAVELLDEPHGASGSSDFSPPASA